MGTKTNIGLGILLLVVVSTGMYVYFSKDARILMNEDDTRFYVPHENYPWIWSLSGSIDVRLFDGSSKMNKDRGSIFLESMFRNESGVYYFRDGKPATETSLFKKESNYIQINQTYLGRYTTYIRGQTVTEKLFFDGSLDEIGSFPVTQTFEVDNASGLYFRVIADDLSNVSPKKKICWYRYCDTTFLSFGKNMQLRWQEKNIRWGWIGSNNLGAGGDSVGLQYDIPSDHEVYSIRLFDPPLFDESEIFSSSKPFIEEFNDTDYTWIDLQYPNTTAFIDVFVGEAYRGYGITMKQDFENYSAGTAIGNVFGFSGTSSVETQQAHSGTKSVRIDEGEKLLFNITKLYNREIKIVNGYLHIYYYIENAIFNGDTDHYLYFNDSDSNNTRNRISFYYPGSYQYNYYWYNPTETGSITTGSVVGYWFNETWNVSSNVVSYFLNDGFHGITRNVDNLTYFRYVTGSDAGGDYHSHVDDVEYYFFQESQGNDTILSKVITFNKPYYAFRTEYSANGNVTLRISNDNGSSWQPITNNETLIYSYNSSNIMYNLSFTDDTRIDSLNITPLEQELNATIYLDGFNESRYYELGQLQFDVNGTLKSFMQNITGVGNTSFCLKLEGYLDYCGDANHTSLLNISSVNTTTFKNATEINVSSKQNITFSINNETDLIDIKYFLVGYFSGSYPFDVDIDEDGDDIPEHTFNGKIIDEMNEQNEFVYSGSKYNSTNISTTEADSVQIFVNLTNDFDVSNFTMLLSSDEQLDEENEFLYNESFDFTNKFNFTLSTHTMAPVGIFDDFAHNSSSRWSRTIITGGGGAFSIANGILTSSSGVSGNQDQNRAQRVDYEDLAADMDRSSLIEVIATEYRDVSACGADCGVGTIVLKNTLYATDGDNQVQLVSFETSHGGTSASHEEAIRNITLLKTAETTWSIYLNGSYYGSSSLSSLDTSEPITLRFYNYASMGGEGAGGSQSGTSVWNVDTIYWGGAWLNRSMDNGTYHFEGNITTPTMSVATTDLQRIILTVDDYVPDGTNIDYYVSKYCNHTSPPFESITPGTMHVFDSIGTEEGLYPCGKAYLNTTINITSPVVNSMIFQVIRGEVLNLSVNFGSDDTIEWSTEYLNSSNSPQVVNGSVSSFVDYRIDNCDGLVTCLYPITLSMDSAAFFGILNLNASVNISSGVSVSNVSYFEDLNEFNVTFSPHAGLLGVTKPVIDYLGDKNLTVLLTKYYNRNKVVQNLTIHLIKSRFNVSMPKSIFSWDVLLNTLTDKNVEPYGQEDVFWNVTVDTRNSKNMSFYVRVNETLPSCLTYEMTSNSTVAANLTRSTIMNTSRQKLFTSLPGTHAYMADYLNFSCTGSTLTYFDVNQEFAGMCDQCVSYNVT